jgi:predicted ATPase/DNA-binding NarL/FixJ family response regulator
MGMEGGMAPLPAWPTSLVGRASELAGLRRLVCGSRLVTVTGPGGVGKTRLAVHVAAGLAGRFPAGVLFADLAAPSGKEQVVPALAGLLAAGDTGGRPPLDAIAERLAEASVLLVLDNCEHLIEECARVVRVLVGRCPELTVLATSREPLLVSGEVVFTLGPLPEDEAVRLFAERARDRSPGFADSAPSAVIRRICARLDGLPLAIELAAARVTLMGAGEIEERLARRFELLASGRRDSPPRHRALAALVEWSYQLLGEDERRLFRSLSVMAGGFDLAAVETLGGDGSLGVLSRLVDKSMVTVALGPGGTRYRLLETLREFGRERLAEAGEAGAAGERHFAYFAAAAESAYDHRMMTGSDGELTRLSQDLDNLRAALGWAGAADPAAALRLAGAMREIWARQGVAEGRSLLERLVAGHPGPDRWFGRALLALGHLAMRQMDHAGARQAFERSHAVCADAGDPAGQAWAAYYCGVAAILGGGQSQAQPWLEEGSRLFASFGNRFGLCRVAGSMGQLLVVSGGDRGEARRLLEQELAIADELSEPWSRGHAHVFLAALELRANRATEAARHAASAAGQFASGQDLVMISIALAFLARALAARDPRRAVRLASAASAMQARIGSQLNAVPQAAIEETRLLAQRAVGAEAADRAWAEGQRLTWAEAIAVAQGRRPRRVTPGGLTAREQQVAELVADGLTNRAVASRLHLSERTVENHVLHACTKLGLANRTQLARWIQERSAGLSTG